MVGSIRAVALWTRPLDEDHPRRRSPARSQAQLERSRALVGDAQRAAEVVCMDVTHLSGYSPSACVDQLRCSARCPRTLG
eukprot:scaffold207_cov409-Prasinococcus_capsulatus_cf.AAC.72